MTHCGNWNMQSVGGGVEAEAAVGARPHEAQNAKTSSTGAGELLRILS